MIAANCVQTFEKNCKGERALCGDTSVHRIEANNFQHTLQSKILFGVSTLCLLGLNWWFKTK